MLILTRNYGESIVIGDEIRVTVLPGKSGTVRRSVAVHREEVYERIKAAGRESAAEPELLVLPEI